MRAILNLNYVNEHVKYNHFRMDSLSDAFKIIQPNSWMGSVDFKDAFYSILIKQSHQKYFSFFWQWYYKYVGMPNADSEAMRIFTKIPKPPFAKLKNQGHLSVTFVHNSYLYGNTHSQCCENLSDTVTLLQSLGFTIHQDESILEPTEQSNF